ncbi:MAG: AMIN domain-containing protein, partial [Candidatus Eisenbacteria bacterium]|nr:AMIN domain-containing protein [Candidatus Eisenbacteria bacterium]
MRSKSKCRFLAPLMALILLPAFAATGAELCRVEDVTVVDKGGAVTEVTINASAPLQYRDFTLPDPPRIVIDCLDAVHAIGTPGQPAPETGILRIRTGQWTGEPGKTITRVVLDLTADLSYSVSTTEKGLIAVVGKGVPAQAKTVSATVAAEPARGVATQNPGGGEVMSLDVQGADINTVLRTLSEFSGRNIVTNKEVKGAVSVRLKNVPWRNALEIILRTQGLAYVEEQGIIRVATATELQNEEIDKQTAERKKEDLLPLVVRRVKVDFANAAELKQSLEKMLTRRGHIEVDQRTNSLLITDIAEKTEAAERLAHELDSMTPQVEITAKMVDVDANVSRELGIVWSMNDLDIGKQNVDEDVAVNAPILDAVGTLRIGAVRDYVTLDATLQALETENKADIISNPKITTVNNREASILVGKEIPLIVQDEAGNPVTELKKIGVTLKVTPHINSENEVTLDLHPEVSDLASQATVQGGVIINTTQADTRVIVRNGETAVIGGLIRENISRVKTGVPILKDIPLLGFFFRSSINEKSKR